MNNPDGCGVRLVLFVSLVSFGLHGQAGRVCYVLIVLGPHKLGFRGQVRAFKVQRDDAVIVHIHNYFLRAWKPQNGAESLS